MNPGQLKSHFNCFRGYPEIAHNRLDLLYTTYPQHRLNKLAVLFFPVA